VNNNVLMPLCNFKLEKEHESFNLNNNSRIININEIDERIISMIRREFTNSKFCNRWDCDYFLESISPNNEAPRRTLDRCITILKLFKNNFIFSGVVYFYPNGRIDILRHYNPFMCYTYDTDMYTISQEEEKKFIAFWTKSFDAPYNTFFPLYRFHLADYRPYSMDSYVDYVESIEGILVPDDNSISKKFRERGAAILSYVDNGNRDEYEIKLKKAYERRSIIVHGKESMEKIQNMSGEDWIEPIREIRDYNRRIIKFIISENLFDYKKRRQRMKDFDPPKSNYC
jgi:hypothetical protein